MVKPVDRLIGDFLQAGADLISVHPESTEHLHRTLNLIREGGASNGLGPQPGDAAAGSRRGDRLAGLGAHHVRQPRLWRPSVHRVQLGESGRSPPPHRRIGLGGAPGESTAASRRTTSAKPPPPGADTFVAGSAIFGSTDYAAAIAAMRHALKQTESSARPSRPAG